MNTQEDRSLSSGVSLPRWMKSRRTDRFNLEQSAFSPTELDDSFMFYYRNNNTRATSEQPTIINHSNIIDNTKSYTAPISDVKPNFSNHTPFCQKFLQNGNDSTKPQQVKLYPTTKTKSSGTDDGFKGEAARCGSSVIRVAHQMVSGKMIHGFNMENNGNNTCNNNNNKMNDTLTVPEGFNPSLRRGSKSLPASPLTSPNSSPKNRRRNKYFTGAFIDIDKNHSNHHWILSNLLLSKRENISQSADIITEETTDKHQLKESKSNLNVNDFKMKSSSYLPKPSEFREMNFWSPTSM